MSQKKRRSRAMKRREMKQLKREVATISASTPIPDGLQDKAKAMMTIVEELSTGSKMKDNQYLTMMNILMDIYKRENDLHREVDPPRDFRQVPYFFTNVSDISTNVSDISTHESDISTLPPHEYMRYALHYSSTITDF